MNNYKRDYKILSKTPKLALSHKQHLLEIDAKTLEYIRYYVASSKTYSSVLLNYPLLLYSKKQKLELLAQTNDIQEAIITSPRINKAITLFRGQIGDDYLKGKTHYILQNFTSASTEQHIARNFGPTAGYKGFFIKFECSSHFPFLHTPYLNGVEMEYIFPKGTEIKIIKVGKMKGLFENYFKLYVCIPTFLDKYSRAKRKQIKR